MKVVMKVYIVVSGHREKIIGVYADPITAQSLAKSYKKEATDVIAWDVIE